MKRRSMNRRLTAQPFQLVRHLINKMEYIFTQCNAGIVDTLSSFADWVDRMRQASKFEKHVSCALLKAHSPNELLNESHAQAPTATEASVFKRKLTICWTSARIFSIYYYVFICCVSQCIVFYFIYYASIYKKWCVHTRMGEWKTKTNFKWNNILVINFISSLSMTHLYWWLRFESSTLSTIRADASTTFAIRHTRHRCW